MSDFNINLDGYGPTELYNMLMQAGYTLEDGALVPPETSRGGFYGSVSGAALEEFWSSMVFLSGSLFLLLRMGRSYLAHGPRALGVRLG
jgi:hypothetical protein